MKDIAAFLERVAEQAGSNQGVSPGARHDDLRSVQAQCEESDRRLEGVLEDKRIEEMKQQMTRNTETTIGVTASFTACFEALERGLAAAHVPFAGGSRRRERVIGTSRATI